MPRRPYANLTTEKSERCGIAVSKMSLAGPCFAFLDRPGSTLGPAQVRRALQRLSAASVSYVTLGEANAAVGEYDRVLELEADGRWSWKPAAMN